MKNPEDERLEATPIIFERVSGLESTPERSDEISGEFILFPQLSEDILSVFFTDIAHDLFQLTV